jgi:hypothetical protein
MYDWLTPENAENVHFTKTWKSTSFWLVQIIFLKLSLFFSSDEKKSDESHVPQISHLLQLKIFV